MGCFQLGRHGEETKGGMFYMRRGNHCLQELVATCKMQIAERKKERWSANMDSARKNTEHVFGSLKKRFFKNTIETHSPEKIENALMTCAALHK